MTGAYVELRRKYENHPDQTNLWDISTCLAAFEFQQGRLQRLEAWECDVGPRGREVDSFGVAGSFMALPSHLLNHNVYFTVYIYIIHCIIPMIGPRLVCLAALSDTKVEHVNASICVKIFPLRLRSSFRRQGYVKIIDFGVGHPGPPVPLVSPTTWVYPFSTVIHLYNT